MPEWSRRNLLKASAGAAVVAVPMAALSNGLGAPSASGRDGDTGNDAELSPDEVASFGGGQVVFSIHDADRGEVAIYHGLDEVIVKDRNLVARIMRAANVRSADASAVS